MDDKGNDDEEATKPVSQLHINFGDLKKDLGAVKIEVKYVDELLKDTIDNVPSWLRNVYPEIYNYLAMTASVLSISQNKKVGYFAVVAALFLPFTIVTVFDMWCCSNV